MVRQEEITKTPRRGPISKPTWKLPRLSEVITYGPSDPIPAASSNHETLMIEVLTNNYIVKKTVLVRFAMVTADFQYNMLIGRPILNALRAVYSAYHLSFKFPIPAGVAEGSNDVSEARECYLATIQAAITLRPESKAEGKRPDVLSIDCINHQDAEKPGRLDAVDEMEEIVLDEDTDGWRMCVDFTDLNKACPKDCYPLPRRDALVDSVMGHEFLCFLDAFKGYHQIGMSEENQKKTAFYTDQDVYCYTTMTFELKNAASTYQRLVNCLFKDQIGRNVEATWMTSS
ncbi:uncharacterized protein LOC113759675 [Coffea eugenioides]|uniref:uncharacterized protein LOC113759675 n=1 Tax=Coffea eugenioides TaxID=49369 RepID=UPI000F60EA25|nr:uncharacterized protein LOC113759675 [Coffea eugenioides]